MGLLNLKEGFYRRAIVSDLIDNWQQQGFLFILVRRITLIDDFNQSCISCVMAMEALTFELILPIRHCVVWPLGHQKLTVT